MDIVEAFKIVLGIAKGNVANLIIVPEEYALQMKVIKMIEDLAAEIALKNIRKT